MRAVDLDNLDLESAQRAITKARKERPWCTRKEKNVYRVRSRRKHGPGGRITGTYYVTFIFIRNLRLATCTCDGSWFGAGMGLVCYHICRAYFKHLHNLNRDKLRTEKAA